MRSTFYIITWTVDEVDDTSNIKLVSCYNRSVNYRDPIIAISEALPRIGYGEKRGGVKKRQKRNPQPPGILCMIQSQSNWHRMVVGKKRME
jgi:hypothetical protein